MSQGRALTVFEYLSMKLSRTAADRLKKEYLWFAQEPGVVSKYHASLDEDIESPHELLRRLFPFNLSKFGEDYWWSVYDGIDKSPPKKYRSAHTYRSKNRARIRAYNREYYKRTRGSKVKPRKV